MLSFPVSPMKAVLGVLPTGDGWAYEIKWDGYRTLAFVDDGHVRLQSSSGRDVTASYPELAGLADGVATGSAILDAELCVLDEHGVPRFELIQRHAAPAILHVFDVLQIDGVDSVSLPYLDRRRLLEALVTPGPNWLVPGFRTTDPEELLAHTADTGMEGVMAKQVDSPYQPGKRSPAWRKVKVRRPQQVVIGGFTPGEGNRSGTFGSLLVGRPGSNGQLVFAGGVGTGFNQAALERLRRLLRERVVDECPFDPVPPPAYRRRATWVEPTLEAEIEIAEFTNDGLVRHASFVRLLDDPAPKK